MCRLLTLLTLLLATAGLAPAQEEMGDPPEVTIGERLFLETRFAQFFFINSDGDVNATLPAGDPVMDQTVTITNTLAGPFAGLSMNCRACHLVDEMGLLPGAGNRTYSDFARRSPIPAREDGRTTTPRNSPALVNATLRPPGSRLLHFDAEFGSTPALVRGTFTGRNFGWLPDEQQIAQAHIARVIREDNGRGALAQSFGGIPYRVLLAGLDPSIPDDQLLPRDERIDVRHATDAAILDAVSRLVAAYTESLVFAQDDEGNFIGSPYDVFLKKNRLPRQPHRRETAPNYARRLRQRLEALPAPQFVTDADGKFQFHDQPFAFGSNELAGLTIFLTEPSALPPSPEEITAGRIGNCMACHAPPNFTDFRFHNTGITQAEYDAIHGTNAFNVLPIPTLAGRNADFDAFLPATPQHPNALGPFLIVPAADHAGTDLGLWNVFANPDLKRPQSKIRRILRAEFGRYPDDQMLDKTIGLFKTPGLRDLPDSAPYFHTGQFDTLESVVGFYRGIGIAARDGTVRSADPKLTGIALNPEDLDALAAFLRSLTEDYN